MIKIHSGQAPHRRGSPKTDCFGTKTQHGSVLHWLQRKLRWNIVIWSLPSPLATFFRHSSSINTFWSLWRSYTVFTPSRERSWQSEFSSLPHPQLKLGIALSFVLPSCTSIAGSCPWTYGESHPSGIESVPRLLAEENQPQNLAFLFENGFPTAR